MNNRKPWQYTLNYTLINMTYFACFCGVHAYAAVFLLGRGFSNTTIGMLLAVANILSVLLQPTVAGFVDKYKAFTNRRVSMVCAIVMAILCGVLYFITNIAAIFIVYVIVYSLQMIYQPLIMAMSFEYNNAGAGINFGLARGLGSCGFAITSAFVGNILVKYGISSLQIVNVIMLCAGALMLLIFIMPAKDKVMALSDDRDASDVNTDDKEDLSKAVSHDSLIDFVKYYPFFSLFVLAGTCMFFSHNALNDYLFQVISPIGGDERIMGYMVMMAAMLELPTMTAFMRLEKKFSCEKLLMLSGIMFFVKTLLMLIAPNIFVAFISQACQIGAYAMFIPASAYFAEIRMEAADKTKGQAYVNVAITLGGVFSSVISGRLLDVCSVHVMLFVATVIAAVGAMLAVFSLRTGKR